MYAAFKSMAAQRSTKKELAYEELHIPHSPFESGGHQVRCYTLIIAQLVASPLRYES